MNQGIVCPDTQFGVNNVNFSRELEVSMIFLTPLLGFTMQSSGTFSGDLVFAQSDPQVTLLQGPVQGSPGGVSWALDRKRGSDWGLPKIID